MYFFFLLVDINILMEDLLQKYFEIKTQMNALQKRADRYRQKIEKEMNNTNLDTYERGPYIVKKMVQNKMCLTRRDLPETIWKEYAKLRPVEFYRISSKRDKSQT